MSRQTMSRQPRRQHDHPTALQAPALPGHAQVPRPRMLRNSLTISWRALLRIRREPEQIADAIAIPVLFTLLFTYLFGGALFSSPGQYLRFLLPGTLVMTVLLITVSAGLSLNADQAGERLTGSGQCRSGSPP